MKVKSQIRKLIIEKAAHFPDDKSALVNSVMEEVLTILPMTNDEIGSCHEIVEEMVDNYC